MASDHAIIPRGGQKPGQNRISRFLLFPLKLTSRALALAEKLAEGVLLQTKFSTRSPE